MHTLPHLRTTMATTDDNIEDVTEECTRCGRATPHSIAVEILTESTKEENAAFSREPYRISECRVCGSVEQTRMNNA